jgi:hypothetical protein
LREVIVADESPPLCEEASKVARHNIVLTLFRALDRSALDHLGLPELKRFSQMLGFADPQTGWEEEYVSLASHYGWDPMKGATFGHFLKSVNDVEGMWYCSNDDIWILLQHLSRCAGLSGNRSYKAAAIRLGDKPLSAEARRILLGEQSYAEEGQTTSPNAQAQPSASSPTEARKEDDAASYADDEDSDDSDADSVASSFHGDTLQESPPVDTEVKVLYTDDRWYTARIVADKGTKAVILYDDGSEEEIDFEVHAVRYNERDSSWEDSSESDSAEAKSDLDSAEAKSDSDSAEDWRESMGLEQRQQPEVEQVEDEKFVVQSHVVEGWKTEDMH